MLIHFGTCSVCDQGLRRPRICGLDQSMRHGMIVCDECEALWLQPDSNAPMHFGESDSPSCPICHLPVWSSSRWATIGEVCLLGWYSYAWIAADTDGSRS